MTSSARKATTRNAAQVYRRVLAARARRKKRGIALIMVLGALTIMTVVLTEFQDETSAELGSALSERDALKAEFAARSALNLSRLLIASEPTIRKAIAPLFLLMRSGPPQIPVWEFADRVLGAFNDAEGNEAFANLSGVDFSEGKNLGIEGARFEILIVDEDSKINVNVPARGDLFSQTRLAAQLIGLIGGPQHNPLFERRDPDGQFSDRQTICSAIIDWTDPDQDASVCDPQSQTAQQAAAEDSFYQLLKQPYERKNAAFDSVDELHLVRGISDDFWATFVEPDPDKPEKRVLTVWGPGAVNVNTANPQTILALVCSGAEPGTPLCVDPNEAAKFLSALTVVSGFTAGAPVFASPRAFVNAIQGKGGMFGIVLEALQLQPVKLLSPNEMLKVVTTESKVFSVYATGVVSAGKRETRLRLHAVVDFQSAPLPGLEGMLAGVSAAAIQQAADPDAPSGAATQLQLPEGATPEALANLFRPNPGGKIVYFRIN